MNQDLRPLCCAQGQGVEGAVQLDHLAVAGREELTREGIDGDAAAHHALGEDGVGNLRQRRRPTVQGRADKGPGHG